MPGLYGITSNANVSVYNTTGLYNLSNANVTLGNTSVSNTPGLYQGLGNPTILTNAQVLYNLLSESGNVQFQLVAGNTLVQAFTADIGTPAGTYGSGLTVPVITTSADGRVTNISQVDITGYIGQYSNANVAAYLPINSANVAGGYFLGNGALLSGLPASSITLTGDVTGSGQTGTPLATTLSSTGATPGTYGSPIFVPQITVDAKGRVTTISNVLVSPGGYANSNVAAYLPVYGGKVDATEVSNSGAVNVASAGTVQLQYDPTGVYNLYDIATGSWVYLDNSGLSFQSNVNGTTKSVYVDNEANLTVDGKMVTTLGVFWANGEIFGGTYSNANVAAYLPGYTGSIDNSSTVGNINANIAQINANVTAVNVAISNLTANVYSNANVAAYLPINSANVSGQYFLGNAFYMTGVGAITYSNANVIAYLPFYPGTLGNSSTIISIQSNVGAYQIWANGNLASTASNVSTLQSNAATQATQINNINANVTAVNVAISNITTNVSILQSNIGDYYNYQYLADVGTNLPRYQGSSGGYYQYLITATASNVWYAGATNMNNMVTTTGNLIGANILGVSSALPGYTDVYDYTIGVSQSIYPWFTSGTFFMGSPLYAGKYANANVIMIASNASIQSVLINNLDANVGAYQVWANSAISSTNANITAANSAISALQSNAATQAVAINSLNANVGAYQIFANANAASQANSITSLNANITAANLAITSLQSNAATQATLINTINANVGVINGNLTTTTFLTNLQWNQTHGYYANVGTIGTNYPTLSDTNPNYYVYQIAFDSNATVAFTANSINNMTIANGFAINNQVVDIQSIGGSAYIAKFIVNRGLYPWFTTSGSQSFVASNGFYSNSVITGAYLTGNTEILSANLGAYQIWANASISAINANVTAANATANSQIASTNANVTAANASIASTNANVTAANASIQTLNANLGAFQTYANATFSSGTYGNANVASYLPTDSLIISIENAAINADSFYQREAVVNNTQTQASANLISINVGGGVQASYVKYYGFSTVANANLAPYLYSITNLTAANGGIVSGLVVSEPTYNGTGWNYYYVINKGTYPWFTGVAPYNITSPGSFSNVVVNALVPDYVSITNAINANVGAYQTWANSQFGTFNYSNVNVAAYLPTDPTITSIQANVTAANASIASINANVTAANANIASINASIASINANVSAANASIQTLSANVGAYQIWSNANASAQANSISAINANVSAANTNISTLQTIYFGNIGQNTYYANLATIDTNYVVYQGSSAAYFTYTIDCLSNGVAVSANNVNNLTTSNGYAIGGNVIAAVNNTPVPGAVRLTFNIDRSIYPWVTSSTATSLPQIVGWYANSTVGVLAPNSWVQTWQIQRLDANIGAYETWANSYFGTSNYSNVNVAAYLPTDPTIQGINANVTAANVNITTLFANAATQATAINAVNANVTAANSAIQTISANLGAYQTWANGRITTLDANLGTATTNITTLFANAATQAVAINTINANVAAANAAIASLQTQTYSNANVASYLPTYNGDLNPNNVVVSGNLTVNGTTTSINYNEYVAGLLVANSTTAATSTTSGALQVKGGAGVVGNVVAGAFYSDLHLYANGQPYAGTYTNANARASLSVTSNSGVYTDSSLTYNNTTGVFTYTEPTFVMNAINLRFDVKNTSGGTLTKGTPVYATGTVGSTNTFTISPSRADTATTMPAIGLLSQDLANNATGYALQLGLLENIDTSAYSVNQVLYVGSTGGLTGARPNDGNVVEPIGTVGRVNANTGAIIVNIWNYHQLPNLDAGNIWVGNVGGIPTQVSFQSYLAANTVITSINANIAAANAHIATLDANIGAYETWANSHFGTSNYSNVNVAAYLPTDPTITAIQANVTAANAHIATLDANVGAYETWANGRITTLDANLGTLTTRVDTLDANVGAFETYANVTFATKSALATLDANVGAYETWANSYFGTSNYSNVNVAAYLPTDPTITGINANVTAANAHITTIDANVGAYETWANGYFASTSSLSSYTPLSTFNVLDANVGAYETWANGYFASTSSLSSYTPLSTFNVLDANVGAYETWANGRITTLDANLGTLTTRVNTLDANLGAFELYANATFGSSSYGNTQVAAYLPTYTGSLDNSSSIVSINANIGAYQTWANGRIATLDANLGTATTNITTLFANAATQATAISTLDANIGAYQSWANVTFYKSGSTITAANLITTNGVFWSNGVAYSTGGGTYGNTQVAAYLPIYAGNISAANMYATSANITGLVTFGSSYKETVYSFGTTSGTITANLANGTIQTVTLNGNMTINTNNFTNMGPGQSVTLVIRQDATGGRTLTSNILFAGNARTLTNAASAVDTLSVFYDGTSYLGALVKGYV